MRPRPVLIVICGLSFAGKTTLARALAAYKCWCYISLDAINEERGVGVGDESITKKEWIQTYPEAYHRVGAALAVGESVVYDETNMLRSQRDELRRIAALHGAEAYVLYVATTATEARQRWQHNRCTGERGDVRNDDLHMLLRISSRPTPMSACFATIRRWIVRHFDSPHGSK
jgi:hypothetical protein